MLLPLIGKGHPRWQTLPTACPSVFDPPRGRHHGHVGGSHASRRLPTPTAAFLSPSLFFGCRRGLSPTGQAGAWA